MNPHRTDLFQFGVERTEAFNVLAEKMLGDMK